MMDLIVLYELYTHARQPHSACGRSSIFFPGSSVFAHLHLMMTQYITQDFLNSEFTLNMECWNC